MNITEIIFLIEFEAQMNQVNFRVHLTQDEKQLCGIISKMDNADEIANQLNTDITAVRLKLRRISMKLGYVTNKINLQVRLTKEEKLVCSMISSLHTAVEIVNLLNTDIITLRSKVEKIAVKFGYSSANTFVKELILDNITYNK